MTSDMGFATCTADLLQSTANFQLSQVPSLAAHLTTLAVLAVLTAAQCCTSTSETSYYFSLINYSRLLPAMLSQQPQVHMP